MFEMFYDAFLLHHARPWTIYPPRPPPHYPPDVRRLEYQLTKRENLTYTFFQIDNQKFLLSRRRVAHLVKLNADLRPGPMLTTARNIFQL
jgi:hypothetical protein